VPSFDQNIAPYPKKKAEPFYASPEWRELISAIIAERDHRCEDPKCTTPGGQTGGWIIGDHIVELKDGGEPLDRRNIMLRCAECHARKTARSRSDRMGAVFVRGKPTKA
jgi:5-methylcytosine-specific restriction endonuclease McrA